MSSLLLNRFFNLSIEIRSEYRNGFYRSSEIDRPIELLLAKLEKMGFIFSRREQQIELLRLALKTYKSIYNDLNISKVRNIIFFCWFSSIKSYCISSCCLILLYRNFYRPLCAYHFLSINTMSIYPRLTLYLSCISLFL